MRRIVLTGHYGRPVEIDLCAPCHLVWFDAFESVRLAGSGILTLLGEMARAQQEPHETLRADARCPRCAGRLKTVHNRSRWGATLQQECRRGHGAWQTFALLLAEKGLVRPLTSADRAALLKRGGALHCLNCGASMDLTNDRCGHCDSPPGVVDVARLAHALDPEGATDAQPVHATAPRHTAFHCLACGAPLAAGEAMQCDHCGATLAVSQLADAHRAVSVLEQALSAHERSPAPHVRERRLRALEADIPRQREWVREMEAETNARRDPDVAFWDGMEGWPRVVAWLAAAVAFALWWRYR
ncbi:MAG: hypothetical protein ACJ8G7_06930 [Rhizobacter sp.]